MAGMDQDPVDVPNPGRDQIVPLMNDIANTYKAALAVGFTADQAFALAHDTFMMMVANILSQPPASPDGGQQ